MPGEDVAVLRENARRSARVQHTQRMLVAACLCAFGVVVVAAALLFQLF